MKQSNLHKLEEHLMAVSDPDSDNYGKHWSHKQIAETFAPSESTVKAVLEWLVAAGVKKEEIRKTQSMGWLEFNATVSEAEKLLRTEYWGWIHEETGQGHVGCEGYWIPE
jgi:tripeptidyl-peptidase-1